MELRINRAVKEGKKVSYAIESGEPMSYDVDCGEGINIVMAPPEAKKAFQDLTFEMLQPYPHSVGVKDSVIAYWKDYAALDYKRIFLCDGSISGLYLINRLFLEKGDRVLGYVPQFSTYQTDVEMNGCVYDQVLLKKEENYKFSAEDVLEMLNEQHKLVYLDNPNNPTGQIIPISEIEKILRAARMKNVFVIVDEAYGDYMPKQNSAVQLADRYDNLIVVKTFSKGFGLAGLRAGYLVLPSELVRYVNNISNPYAMSELSRSVAARTIKDEAFLEVLMEKTSQIKRQLLALKLRNISIAETADTVSICLLTHHNTEVDLANEFAKRRILVISGKDFHNLGKNSVRLRVPGESEIEKVLNALKEIDEN
ncbi:histidinol-phosphate aminotransferase family protein [Anaerotignum lactatifermentans]|uniref:Histidinol-phosphate aminotransferase family protein n=1 Tax=Anaerotignum lactatifermentans TaxID=160404 RepID=A0ABS2G8B6_9FIRM|nr:histidinol-phosphate transaminase [Anaerotignum lactatifermentans]MBM6829357.1 histidinol-phosphate aminotransferase family protein [Anaerotignum lactatifermentans]MBM6877402.1 histidinol-phosphate aminotransferase family protein [Anaerotignum lactatifermentans]MBM6950934.1 histidinol-phosphate aminotransferase family protein [Anaerotignum lactatifermentans]